MLKMTGISVLAALIMWPQACCAADDQQNGIKCGTSVDINNKYFSQGFLNHDSPAIQPSIYAGYSGFSIRLWKDYDVSTGRIYEDDYIIDYTYSLDRLELKGGYKYFTVNVPGDGCRSQELFLEGKYDVMLSPTLAAAYDIDACRGFYASAGISNGWDFIGTELEAGALVELNMNYWRKGTGLSTAVISISDEKDFAGGFYLKPNASLVMAIDRRSFGNNLVFGISSGIDLK